ncbi:uncharacterized protein [Diadema antillarum]|uniref:uncharacterized protein n=1 Tax=Diadema antillarum TaxID=105358 RepID=UPI003A864DDE
MSSKEQHDPSFALRATRGQEVCATKSELPPPAPPSGDAGTAHVQKNVSIGKAQDSGKKTMKKIPKKAPHTVSKAPSEDRASTSGDVSSHLDKLENLLAEVVKHLPQSHDKTTSRAAVVHTGASTSKSTAEEFSRLPTNVRHFVGDDFDTSTSEDAERDGPFDFDEGVEEVPPAAQLPQLAAKYAIPLGIGEAVDEEIAKSVNYFIGNKLEDKAIEETVEKYPPPSNCPHLDTPKVNAPIWEHLQSVTRNRDLKLQRVQKCLTRGIGALLRSLDARDISESQQDALALLSNAHFELNCVRKELIKPDINSEYVHLCKPSTPVTQLLFGDDLTRQMKDLKEQHKASAGVMRTQQKHTSRPSGSFHPYRRPFNSGARRQARDAGWTGSRSAAASRFVHGTANRPFLDQRYQGKSRPPPQQRPQSRAHPQARSKTPHNK